MRKRLTLRSARLASLLGGAALALGGCHGCEPTITETVANSKYDWPGQLTVMKSNYSFAIWAVFWGDAPQFCNTSPVCTLNQLRRVCDAHPQIDGNLLVATCRDATNADREWDDFAGALLAYGGAGCLAIHAPSFESPPVNWTHREIGEDGCR